MEAINSRIMVARNHLGLNQTKFAQKIGVTSQLINKIESGNAKLTETTIHLICLTFGVREEWLREGKGEILDDEALLSERERRLFELFRRLSPKAQQIVIDYVKKVLSDEQALRGESPEGLKQALGGATQPPEAPQEAKRQESMDDGKGANPIHNKKRG